jgi:heme-degrading monooxygenase HmoA
MILEVAVLNIRPDLVDSFEPTFRKAAPLLAASPGCITHELQRCIEDPNRYLLVVLWETLTDHTEGFRGSERYEKWRSLLHHFYDPFPTVEHYEQVPSPSTGS